MSNDIETFINLIYKTDSMCNLRSVNFKKFLKCVKQTQNWSEFKNVEEIVKLKNTYINSAIKEILGNERFLKIIKEETNINIKHLENLMESN